MISTLEMSTLGAISSPGFIGWGVPSREDIADDGVVAVLSDALPPGGADIKAGGAVAQPAAAARYRLVTLLLNVNYRVPKKSCSRL